MTAVLDAADDVTVQEAAGRLAPWPARAGALLVDVVPAAAVIATMSLLALAAPTWGWLWWVFTGAGAAALLLLIGNRTVAPALTGWTLGRALFGITVLSRGGARPGLARLAFRDLAHLLDTVALFVGWLWPLWDKRNRTFADLLLGTEVHAAGRPARDIRRLVGAVLVAATVAAAAGVGLGYLAVYRPERAVDAARAQIAEQGPRIIEQMLSYQVDTLQQDFAHAQTLTTDSYRPQLIAQQQAVSKGEPTSNEYWAVSSAVLSARADRATMLLAMQGQRGSDPQTLKFITATVRADFDRGADGQWRVADITVLKKPQMGQAGQ